ncbi:hypothetical protein P879_02326 [Paragonimus westermani]|uniref:Ras-GEF domain-containing protein n=1 Tax=Paragonimus westermani TaxID=34504 RepID=A0A8T0DL12_9TREM|nr:hypothetical protein P879_02326 [Paragonimus westermani]
MRLQRQAKHPIEKSAMALSLPRSCTLPDLFDLILNERNLITQTSIIDAILHSYRLFASADQMLQTIDTKFRDLCYSESLDVDAKLDAIRLLRVFLSRWLQPPHMRDFDSALGLSYLQRLIRMLADWFSVFRPKSSTCESGRTVILVDGAQRSAAHSRLPCPDYPVIRCMFFSADPTRLERMAYKLDQLGNFAESRLRWAQMHQSHTISASPTRINGGNSPGSPSTPLSPALTKAPTTTRAPTTIFNPEQMVSLNNLQPSKIAEELTVRDQILFLQLLLPECLLYARKQPSPTVRATIDQFNRVVCAVQNSILRLQTDSVSPSAQLTASKQCPVCVLRDPSPARVVWSRERLMQRSDNAARNNPVTGDLCITEADVKRANEMRLWIDVASELDKLSNLSSLHAVLTALQSNPVHRLRHCWAAMDRYYVHHMHKLEGLLTLMSHENNYEQLRARINKHIEVVRRKEAARWKRQADKKYSPSSPGLVHSGRRQMDSDQNTSPIPGIIPYLGLFFQDLTFLNYAFPDGEDSGNSKHLQSGIHERPSLASPSGKSITSNLSSPSSSCSSSSASNPSTSGDFVSKNKIGNKTRIAISNLTTHVPRSPRSRSAAGVACKSPPMKIAPDLQSGTLINFEKHMREAEFLKDLYILQYSAESYRLHSDVLYARWFDAFPALTEEEARQLSLEIEPELDSVLSTCQFGKQKKFASEMNLHRISAVSTYSCSPSDDSHSSQFDSTVSCMSVPRTSQSRRPSLLTHPYFEKPAATTTSLSSSCSDISPTPSPPTVFIPKSTKLRSRPESRPTHMITKLTHSDADSTCTLLLPPVPPKRSTSAQKLPDVKTCSNDEKTLQVRVRLEDPTFLCAHSSVHLKPPKSILARGSTPDLSTASRRSLFSSNATASVTVSSTETISDLLARALANFGIPLPQVMNYNLILVRPGLPDHLLPMDANAFDTLMQAPTKYKPFAGHSGQPIECVCVRQLQGLSSSTFSGFRQPVSPSSVGNKDRRHQRSLSKPGTPRHLRMRGSLNQFKFPPS